MLAGSRFINCSGDKVLFCCPSLELATLPIAAMARLFCLSHGHPPAPPHYKCTPPPTGHHQSQPAEFPAFRLPITALVSGNTPRSSANTDGWTPPGGPAGTSSRPATTGGGRGGLGHQAGHPSPRPSAWQAGKPVLQAWQGPARSGLAEPRSPKASVPRHAQCQGGTGGPGASLSLEA